MKHLCLAWALALTLAVSFWGAATPVSAQEFGLRDGDRVVFYGDSITEQKLYTNFVESYVLTRYPQLKVNFINSGWSADRVMGGYGGTIDQRLQRDVLPFKPTVVTILLGMNDGKSSPFDQDLFDTYANGYQHIIETIKIALPEARITVMVPSPYDDTTRAPNFTDGYNAVLVRYGQYVSELAQRERLGLADLNTPVVAMLQKAKLADPVLSQKIVPDRVHPGPGGHIVMAAALLKSWNAPALVTAVEIDAAAKRVLRSDYTRITDLQGQDNFSWTQNDASLPMPLDLRDPIMALAVRSSDVIAQLNQQPLTVRGLALAKYDLRIDGTSMGVFTREQLADGINLAELPTPMMTQAAGVHALTNQHNLLRFMRWRQLQVPLQNDPFPAVQNAVKTSLTPLLNALDTEEADVVARQRAAAQPVSHRYELVPQL